MHIPSKHVYEILVQKGVEYLFHANSVATASMFLKYRSLMSRGNTERNGLKQTPQTSDDVDKRYSVWYDIFLDAVDIHRRASKINAYGPVTFVIDVKILDRNNTGRIWVTKLNPTKWANKSEKHRWFQNKQDLEENFFVGRFDQMLVLRHCGGELPLKNYISKIIVDDPQIQDNTGVDFYSMAVGALKISMSESELKIPIERRICIPRCNCLNMYKLDINRTSLMFEPYL
ncbi:hypothetical protein [Olivibacter domesticus]|uniref:Uncharacterized protein n=1 Tax=Olivibacter domesticus TaxID=407022 RepID=A0A1H7GNA5_OLID1|nr:hypothetical protein [Olivibacter domesticus]SEK39643.1 hypothetical protein SAMN05661044_00142 [Olivibacter domesticus]